MLTTPRPLPSVCIRSSMLSIGSPKKLSAPCCSMPSRPRWIAPIDAAETLPYSVVKDEALSPTCWHIARRSFKSSNNRPLSSAILNTSCSTPDWVSLRLSRRESRSGPRSEMVARTGWPFSPNTSQQVTGQPDHFGSSSLSASRRSFTLPPNVPASAIPERSPLMSAMNTGTPMAENCSASFCNVTVLPVPVAPVMRPWRFASAGKRASSMSLDFAISSGAGTGKLQ